MRDPADAYVVTPGSNERRWMGRTFTDFLATGERTAGTFALVDEQAPRGETVPLHRHRDDDESFYIVDGEVTLYIGDGPGVRAGAGSFAHVPGGVVHGFRVESETARYLILTTARHGEFYRAITMPAGAGGQPPSEALPGGRIEQACRAFGIEFVGPLPA